MEVGRKRKKGLRDGVRERGSEGWQEEEKRVERWCEGAGTGATGGGWGMRRLAPPLHHFRPFLPPSRPICLTSRKKVSRDMGQSI